MMIIIIDNTPKVDAVSSIVADITLLTYEKLIFFNLKLTMLITIVVCQVVVFFAESYDDCILAILQELLLS